MSLRNSSLKHVLIVEGNIGAGKSTFLRLMEQHLMIDPVFEPHTRWQHVGDGENLLEKFYTDIRRWAYTFQTYAFVTRILEQERQLKQCTTGIQVLERSVYSDRYCFAKNCYEMGVMQPLEWQLYCDWFSWLVDGYSIKPTGFIYLHTDPAVCYNRLRTRNRHEEAKVPLDYLVRLHRKHEDWLVDRKGVADYLQHVPVLVLSCNNDFEHDQSELNKHLGAIVDAFGLAYKQPSNQPERMISC
jgi:deoxyadenosine/deoxycytidine kinase